ncbi:MAG: hypothetical protein AB8B87_17825 [Granulosicoccus sp.]
MLRYLPGIVLVQIVTLALLWVNRQGTMIELLSSVALPALLLSAVIALWFSAISRMAAQKTHASLVEKHFQEREKLTREIERSRVDALQKASADQARLIERASYEREQLIRETHKDMIKAERRASRNANIKVGAAFAAVTAAGVGFLMVQFMTLGLLTITAASGALGGYLIRWRQTRHVMQLATQATKLELPAPDNPAPEKHDKLESSPKPFVIDANSIVDDSGKSG